MSEIYSDKKFFILFGLVVIIFLIFLFYKWTKRKRISKLENIQKRHPLEQNTLTKEREEVSYDKKLTNQKETKKKRTKNGKNNTESKNEKNLVPIKVVETVEPEKEEQSKAKLIGYYPINIFAQTEPLNYPYVLMPKPHCVIKFPRKGRSGRKGFKEEDFKEYINKYFRNDYNVFDDRFILIKNNSKPFEPDFTIIDEKKGINIFLDIEIDEPYEGLNSISERKPTHFQYSDINRNNTFKSRGWIIIRFAEIQIHQEPDSCCRFIADTLKSINPKYVIPEKLIDFGKVTPVRQWTKREAQKMSIERYREKYLGIESFGLTIQKDDFLKIEETELGNKIEELVEDESFIPVETKKNKTKLEKIHLAIHSSKYLSFSINEEKVIVKPVSVVDNELVSFCYVKNRKRNFLIYNIANLKLKDSYYTLRVAGPTIGLEQIKSAVTTAIKYHKLIRMKYTRRSWINKTIDEETGELLIDRTKSEQSIRTINDIQLSLNVLAQEKIETYNLNNNYITAYCNKREEQRTFKFDRIGEIEILNI